MSSEFELIRRHFTLPTRHTALGVGDDAALIVPRQGMEVVVTTDMLVEGVHFFAEVEPRDLGWKTLAVNVSDIAAMGAEPRWAFLAIALPEANEAWVRQLSQGFRECAERFGVDLAGGDTTRGPLTLSVTLMGEVPAGKAVRRDGARPGDDIWVTGHPGQAALGLAQLSAARQAGRLTGPDVPQEWLSALLRPMPRVEAGLALREHATAMLDVSDGLLGDLQHILERSQCGADIEIERLPAASLLSAGATSDQALNALLGGGDDYELLFTTPIDRRPMVDSLSATLGLTISRIGRITEVPGQLRLIKNQQERALPAALGYDHFQT